MRTYEGPWLFPGECIKLRNEPACAHIGRRHRHKVRFYEENDLVTVHDPSGDRPGRVTHEADDVLYIEGPRIPGDSRSLHWQIRGDLVERYVSPREAER